MTTKKLLRKVQDYYDTMDVLYDQIKQTKFENKQEQINLLIEILAVNRMLSTMIFLLNDNVTGADKIFNNFYKEIVDKIF